MLNNISNPISNVVIHRAITTPKLRKAGKADIQ